MGLYNRGERRICAEEEEDVSIMKRGEIYKFIKEELRKEYIRSLKSFQTTLVFFIGKKNGKKHMVQNYWYLNKWTIKNNYPLLLIFNIVENIGINTKLDL